MNIEVKTVETQRDGIAFRWRTLDGKTHQKFYRGKKHRNKIEQARVDLEQQLNRTGSDEMWSSFCQTLSEYFEGMSPRTIEKSQQTLRKFNNLFGNSECSELSKEHMRLFKES